MTILATGPSGPLHELDLLSAAGRRANLRLVLEQILSAARGEAPAHCVNPDAIPRWRIRR